MTFRPDLIRASFALAFTSGEVQPRHPTIFLATILGTILFASLFVPATAAQNSSFVRTDGANAPICSESSDPSAVSAANCAVLPLRNAVAKAGPGLGRASESEGDPVVGISAGQSSVSPSTEVIVPLVITDTTARNIIAYQFNILFDPDVIVAQANPVVTAGTLSEQMAFAVNPNTPGIIRVAVYGTLPLSGAGILLKLRFNAVGSIGSTTALTWQNVLINEGDPANAATNGRVTIAAPATEALSISGYVRNVTGLGLGFTQVLLSSDNDDPIQVRTVATGYFEFGGLVAGRSYTVAAGRMHYGFTPTIINVTNNLEHVDLVARP